MLTLFTMEWGRGWGHIVPVTDSFVCSGSIRDLEQGFWINKFFFRKFWISGVVVHLLAPSLKSKKWCCYRFTNRNIVLQQLLNYKHISLVFSQISSKSTWRQNLQNKLKTRIFCNLLTRKFYFLQFPVRIYFFSY